MRYRAASSNSVSNDSRSKLVMPIVFACLLTAGVACSPKAPAGAASGTPVAKSTVEPENSRFLPTVKTGFVVSEWARVPSVRSLAVSPDGKTVFTGSKSGDISKITVQDGVPKVEVFLSNLNGSNGVCFLGEDLIVAELTRVRRFAAKDGFAPNSEGRVILNGLPDERHHGARYIKAGPDGRIRIGIGAPCNVCLREDDPRFATLSSFDGEGNDFRIDAKGVRNTVGFDWDPESGELFFTDNGRDMLGDDIPPCELNRLAEGGEGAHYGFPFLWGDNQPDPEFGERAPELEFVKPFVNFDAHVAPLGCHFPKVESLRKAHPSKIFTAQHGSWNRSEPIGYQVVTVDLKTKAVEPFLWGFLDKSNGDVYGRPVDVAELADGTLLVSDDHAGVIWAVKTQTATEEPK